jgi:hypothetical protein
MNTKKLKLQDLKVKSFITLSPNDSKQVKGGSLAICETWMTNCDMSCLLDCNTLYYSLDHPCRTDVCQGSNGCNNTRQLGCESSPMYDFCV